MKKFLNQYHKNVNKSKHFIDGNTLPNDGLQNPCVKFIAYYLPQFHRISENDKWWGKGFTEWTNVTKALPRYHGHLQPRLPGDLGFYDLSELKSLKEQSDFMRRAGVYGICIHDYWFDGSKVLDTPLKLILENKEIDIKFCLNWANENWTRRWDGYDDDVLLKQSYGIDNCIGYAKSLLPALKDSRYIKIGERPLIMIYRPSLIPNAKEVFAKWRDFFKAEGIGDPYLVMAQTFGDCDPRRYGLDAAAGFPPHNGGFDLKNQRNKLNLYDKDFSGNARSYHDMVKATLANFNIEYQLFPGVCPSWDNEARKPRKGTSFFNSSPEAFEDWLVEAGKQTLNYDSSERLLFINAWNEWAEGAVLEPDQHYGFAHLVAIRNALTKLSEFKLNGKTQILSSYPAYCKLSFLNYIPNFTRAGIRYLKLKYLKN